MAYLTTEPYMLRRFDRESRRLGLPEKLRGTRFEQWHSKLKRKLFFKIGLNTMEEAPLEPVEGPIETFEGYFSQRVEINTEPGIRMPFYALTPAGLQAGERRPVILALHGHRAGGKAAVAGREDISLVAGNIKIYNYAYGVQLARAGFVVLCPDARGFGERRELLAQGDSPEQFMAPSCDALNKMALPLGQTLLGMMVWDLMRLIDYSTTRAEWDSTRLGCLGFSGGGMQTLWLGALDQRVQVMVTSGYFYGFKDAFLRLNSNCSCNYIPGLWQLVDMGDLGALICPRPLLVESGSGDHLNGERGMANVNEQLAITARAYNFLNFEERLYHSVFDGPHRYDGCEVIPWFKRWL